MKGHASVTVCGRDKSSFNACEGYVEKNGNLPKLVVVALVQLGEFI